MAVIQGNAHKSSVTGFYPLNIEQSLRLNDDDSAYLSRTPASAGNRKTWTLSFWMKPCNLSSAQVIFGAGSNTSNTTRVDYRADRRFQVFNIASGVQNGSIVWDPYKFRDPSAWYHFVFVADTTQATDSNRYQFYVNGERLTGISSTGGENTFPSINADTSINNNIAHEIGRRVVNNTEYFDGYLAEVHFCDGTAYDADAFGEFKSGVWVAKSPSVTYGTNGFYLDFANSADIGNDVSGEGNDWTPNNFTASDVVLDSPTNNFATLNALAKNPDRATLSDGNLKIVGTDTNWAAQIATIGVSSGKWYAEFTFSGSGGNDINVGIQSEAGVFFMDDTDHYLGKQSVNFGYFANGNKVTNASQSAYGATFTNSDVIGVALNMDDGEVTFYKNGVSQGIAFTGLSGTYFIGLSTYRTGTANFGQLGFTYTPPTGYLALSTANLPEPTISPADDASPSDYFNTVLYTGNGSTQSVTGVGFQPDFTWIKTRSIGYQHSLYDAVRGTAAGRLASDQTAAEVDNAPNNPEFISDGIEVKNVLNDNASGQTLVAWNWKANGSGVSNTDGTITSTVSANTTSGFSIVSYTGTGANATVGHGLDSAPDLVIVKPRNAVNNWVVYHSSIGATKYLLLNTTAAEDTASIVWNDTAPTSSVFSVGTNSNVNGSGTTEIAYCFSEVEGFSKFGSYTGAGNTSDNTFVYTGFAPALIIYKRVNDAGNWVIRDNKRDPYNPSEGRLLPNSSAAEDDPAGDKLDFLSNGFKLRTYSFEMSNSEPYIYMAFAENPFKYSNAR